MKLTIEELESILINPSLTSNGKNLQAECPHCGHREFFVSIDKENHPSNCYRKKKCGFTGNIYTLAKIAGKYKQLIEDGIKNYSFSKIEKQIINDFSKKEYVFLDEIILPSGYVRLNEPNKYLISRKFNIEDCLNYEVGVSKLDPKLISKYLIFPVYFLEKMVSYVSRLYIKSDYLPKYRNSETKFENIFYGLDKLYNPDIVILVEGIFDKIGVDKALSLYNIKSDNILVLSTFGASLTDMQKLVLLMLKPKEVLIMYDSDVYKIAVKTLISINYIFEKVGLCVIKQYDKSKKIDPGNSLPEYIIESLDSPKYINDLNEKIGPNYFKKHTLQY